MNKAKRKSGNRVLAATMLLMVALGSVHAFSVFIEPLEEFLSTSRTQTSLTYSLALIFLTISVLFGHRVYYLVSPQRFLALVCTLAIAGCLIATYSNNIYMIWLGYSLIFGTANGLGYGYSLQYSAHANPGREGLAMGLVTACYAIGAAIAPYGFVALMNIGGYSSAMTGLAAIIAILTPVVFGLLKLADVKFKPSEKTRPEIPGNTNGRMISKLWLAYGAAVFAGLMAIGHATEIARNAGLSPALIVSAPAIIAALNMIGSFTGGWLADTISNKVLLITLAILSALALFALPFTQSDFPILACLGMIGFSYGATIAIYPAAVNKMFDAAGSVKAYGKVFTAWGFAGLAGPLLAGLLYEKFEGYTIALWVAGLCGIASVLMLFFIPMKPNNSGLRSG